MLNINLFTSLDSVMELLVTGGAGYIGSHIVIEAMESGHNVTVFDDLSSGSIENIKDSTKFVKVQRYRPLIWKAL